MKNKAINELTTGSIGPILYRFSFRIVYTEGEIRIKMPFKKIKIPISAIDRVIIRKRAGIHHYTSGCLNIEHHNPNAPANIAFVPRNPATWLALFKEKNIPVENNDNIDLVEISKLTSKINWAVAIIAVLFAFMAIIFAIIAFLKQNQ